MIFYAGTGKVAKPYKIGKTTVDVMLEILNLDKKEAVSIDAISNQDFSEVSFIYWFAYIQDFLFPIPCCFKMS